MPRKKSAAKPKKITKKAKSSNVFEYLRFGESYTSLVLGIIAVIIATVLLLSFVGIRQQKRAETDIVPTAVQIDTMHITITPGPTANGRVTEKTYTVAPEDSLWSISLRVYGNGYNWVEIAKANNLADPNTIHAGDRLNLPSVKLQDATVQTGENEAEVSRTQRVMDTNDSYTVVSGDDLWDIAVREYKDGFQWVKIAQANHLANPDIIHSGNVLIIPRN